MHRGHWQSFLRVVRQQKMSGQKLLMQKRRLQQTYAIDVRIITVDFSKAMQKGFSSSFQMLKELPISMLVNNVGVNYTNQFHLESEDSLKQIISVNCAGTILITRSIIQIMLKQDHRSAIINVSSASMFGYPYYAAYGASKAFVDTMSRALSKQYDQKLDILSLTPSFVNTRKSNNKDSFFCVEANQFIQSSMKKLGRQQSCMGHWRHELHYLISSSVPGFIFKRILKNNFMKALKERQDKA